MTVSAGQVRTHAELEVIQNATAGDTNPGLKSPDQIFARAVAIPVREG